MNTKNYEAKKLEDNNGYYTFEEQLRKNFQEILDTETPLFTVHAEDSIWDEYLLGIEPFNRQHYNCNCCKTFIRKYGKLVYIDGQGEVVSAIWRNIDMIPEYFEKSVINLKNYVEKQSIYSPFISDERTLGNKETNGWGHLSLELSLNSKHLNKSRIKTAGQLMAEKREEFLILNRALDSYSIKTIEKALQLLKSDAIYRGGTQVPIAEWFLKVKEKSQGWVTQERGDNFIWYHVATAPQGFTHIRSSMIGTLLDDIQAGMSNAAVAERFAEKMSPSNYQRSQSAPTESAIMQAEKLIQNLGLTESLERRYATLEEIPEFIWATLEKKAVVTQQSLNVFGGITPKAKATKPVDDSLPVQTMTWDKFSRTVLPQAQSIEAKIDNPSRFMALVTAEHPDAENIMQWDNPFSWYYHGGVDGEIKRRVEEAGGRYENNDIRASLIWETYTDLDLHCITPTGRHIYYGDKNDYSGGSLDVDKNVRPDTLTPVENIRFEKGRAARGVYRFYVDNYFNRSSSNQFKVELEVESKIYTFEGDLNDQNSSRVTVFEFEYTPGQEPRFIGSTPVGQGASAWNVEKNSFVKVNAITKSPNLWGEKVSERAGNHTFFLLDGVKDVSEGKGRGFFNEHLKSELKEIRKTLEAYTATTPINGLDEANACGLGFSKDSEWDLTLRVKEGNLTRLIKIDRLD